MAKFRVAICFEEGVVIEVDANSVGEAEAKAEEIADYFAGSRYPEDYNPNRVHRSFYTQDGEEINNG